jgi:hypothetical protein
MLVAVSTDSTEMTISRHNPNENELVCQGQFISGGPTDSRGKDMTPCDVSRGRIDA